MAQRCAALVTLVLGRHPLFEAVLHWGRPGHQRRAVARARREFHPLARACSEQLVGCLDLQAAAQDAGPGDVILPVDAVGPGTLWAQPGLARTELELRCRLRRAQANCQLPAVKFQAHATVVQPYHLEFGGRPQAQRGGPHP
jgi:hypothetical protein